jgi:hypothetical protein
MISEFVCGMVRIEESGLFLYFPRYTAQASKLRAFIDFGRRVLVTSIRSRSRAPAQLTPYHRTSDGTAPTRASVSGGSSRRATTMVDYYGLPQTGDRAWPGRQAASSLPFERKATSVEQALLQDVLKELQLTPHFRDWLERLEAWPNE